MKDNKWKSLRVREYTHQRIKRLAVDFNQTIDDLINILADAHENRPGVGEPIDDKPGFWDFLKREGK